MGKNDIYMKSYLSDKARFADLFNCIIGQGQELFSPDDMRIISGSLEAVMQGKGDKELGIERHRDIIMETRRKEKLILLAIENQEEIHYAMPVRSMMYDALNYTNQVRTIAKENKTQQRFQNGTEYLSGMRKQDKLCPVITLVFYYGSQAWDGGQDIYDLLDIEQSELSLLKQYIPNYRMNLIQASDLANITGDNCFKTDLQWMFGMLKYKEDKNGMSQYMKEHSDFFGSINEDEFGAAKAILGSPNIPKVLTKTREGKGGIDMCKAWDDWHQDGVNEGISMGIERGIERGIEQGENRFRSLCLKLSETGNKLELEKVLRDKEYCKILYQKYQV